MKSRVIETKREWELIREICELHKQECVLRKLADKMGRAIANLRDPDEIDQAVSNA